MIDRLEAMRIFLAALDEGSLAAAGKRLGKSPAAISRAVAFLENHVGAQLMNRTTRYIHLTAIGEKYSQVCRSVLAELDEADLSAAGSHASIRGLLTITSPVMFGTKILRPVVSAFLRDHPEVQIRLLLLDRMMDLISEQVDVALRIAHLPDSAFVALRVGEVRKVLCASPKYLSEKPRIATAADLANHDCIEITETSPNDMWSFPPAPGQKVPRSVRVKPRLFVNADQAAVNAAVDGEGILRILSYKIYEEIAAGELVILLPEDEPPPLPVHLMTPPGRSAVAKVRVFLDFARPLLRAELSRSLHQH